MSEDEIQTNSISTDDKFQELVEKIKSKLPSPEQYSDIKDLVGLYIKRNDNGYDSADYQQEVESILGVEYSIPIHGALDSYSNQKEQYNLEGSQLYKQTGADPVMMFNGQFVYTAQDIKIKGAGMDFIFNRTYKNQAYYNGPLGFNWDHNYNLWLRVEGNTIIRSSGELREDVYIQHEIYRYYLCPGGYHDVIEQYTNNSFILTTANGTKFIYEQINATNIYRIRKIEDRNKNYLLFYYGSTDDKLQSVEVNHRDRKVEFHYDEQNRINEIKTFGVTYKKKGRDNVKIERTWRYSYDDFGDLVSVITPSTDRYPDGLITYYEYSSYLYTGEPRHNLLRIIDPVGQVYLENEFGAQKGILSYNRVTRQRQGNGEYYFEYADVIPEQSWDYSPEEMPAYITTFYQRNGHAIEHLYNRNGNLIVKREKILQGCNNRELVSRYRYNKDGVLVGSLSPEGNIVQYYYGRDDYNKQHQRNENVDPSHDPDLMKEKRLKFGNILAVVRRGRYYDILQMNLDRGLYGDFFPDIFTADNNDIVIKYSYEQDYQQITSISDPRFTKNADPRDTEVTDPTSDYNRHLTTYEYYPLSLTNQAKNLMYVKYPDTTFPSKIPDGSHGLTNISEEYLQYDTNGRLEKVKDPEGNVTEFRYFKSISYPYETKEGYLYKEIRDITNLKLTTEYDVNEAGQITTTKNPKGFLTIFIVNELDQTTEAISTGPRFKTISFFNGNNLVECRKRDNIDNDGNVSPDGPEVTTYRYDSQNNIIKETIGGSDLSVHHVTEHFYDTSDKKIKTVLPEGNAIHYDYEERLLLKAIKRGACTPIASITRMIYDGNGRKAVVIDGCGNATRFQYDPFDRLIATIDADGNVKQAEYDKMGNAVIERFFEKRSDDKYYLLSRKAHEYDERGNKIHDISYLFFNPIFTTNLIEPDKEFNIAQNQGSVTPIDTQYFYDKKKHLFRILNAKAQETTYEYDGIDRKIMEKDNLGNYITTTYDENSNIYRIDRHEVIIDPQSGSIIREEVFSTINQYDELDRKIATIDNLGNRTEFGYDSRNNLVVVKDALANIKRYAYDVFNRKIAEIAETTETGLGGDQRLADIETRYFYNKNNNLTSIKDADGAETHYDYDLLNRIFRITFHQNKSFKQLAYDRNDNVIFTKDNNGLIIHYTYDLLNRKIDVYLEKAGTFFSYPSEADNFEKYTYDGLGRALIQKNNFCEIKSDFDSLSRPYHEEIKYNSANSTFSFLSRTFVLDRSFDVLSNLLYILYPSRREIEYQYDSLNRVVRIINKKKGDQYLGSATFRSSYEIARFEYGGLRLFKAVYGNQTGYQLFYDGLSRIISIRHSRYGSGRPLLEIQQLNDGVGNKRFEINITSTRVTKKEIYKYDSLYRLTNFDNRNINTINPEDYKPPTSPLPLNSMNGQKLINSAIGSLTQDQTDYAYKYDKLGNRIKEKQPRANVIDYITNLLNQYERRDNQNFDYDFNGNMIDDEGRRYFYNYRNQLVKVLAKENNKCLVNIAYDVKGCCIGFKENSLNSICLINDGFNTIEEYDINNLNIQYVHENRTNQLCQTVFDSEEYWYHRNTIESSRLLSNSHGRILNRFRYDYDPFGNLRESARISFKNPYLFAGKRLYKSIGIYDSHFRNYLSSIGRFLQRDPKGYSDGYNLYAYVGNNPLSLVDIMGTERKTTHIVFERGTTIRGGHPLGTVYRLAQEAEDPAEKEYYEKLYRETLRGTFNQGYIDFLKFFGAITAISTAGVLGGELGSAGGMLLGTKVGLGTAGTALFSASLGGAASATSEELVSMSLGKEQTAEGFVKNMATGALVSAAPVVAGIVLKETSSFIRSFTQSGAIHKTVPVDPKWRSSVEDFIASAEDHGFKVRGKEVTVKTPLGDRKVDLILESPDGKIGGIELKSTETEFARFRKEQFAKDNWINMYGGRATGENAAKAGIDRVDYMMKILWQP